MPPPLVYHFSATSSTPEEWLPIHTRRLQIQTLHHNALSINDDGRIAFATGPILNILHPPLQPPLHSTLNSALRRVYMVNSKPGTHRKDTVSTTNHLSTLIWADTAILIRNGSASLIMLRLPQQPNNSLHFSLDSFHRWNPTPLSLLPPPTEGLPSDMSPLTNRLRFVTFTRISYLQDQNDPESPLLFTSFIVCATESATDLYPIDVNAPHSTFSRPISSAFRIHHRCTVTVSCIDGIYTENGLRTLVAVSDDARELTVYAVSMVRSHPVELESIRVWNSSESFPPAPILSLSWNLHSARKSFITLATTSGNDVVIIDWGNSSQTSINASAWAAPRIHFVIDAHEHIVTAVQICHDGSVVSAGMDGRVVCWRININSIQIEPTKIEKPFDTFAAILQEKGERNEPVMALKQTSNALAIVIVNSTLMARHIPETCEIESSRKLLSTIPDTLLRLLVIPPYGTVKDVEQCILSRTRCLMSHPSLLERPMMSWDASHYLHFFTDCADAVVPKLFEHLVDMTNRLEAVEDSSAQQFIQSARALLWLSRVINHPHSEKTSVNASIKDVSRRLSNSLLYMHYGLSLRNFLIRKGDVSKCTHMERLALENMCQFIVAWQAQGWAGRLYDLRMVDEVQERLAKHGGKVKGFCLHCPVCACSGKESALKLMETDPAVMRCPSKHQFERCILSCLTVTESVALECSSCKAQATAFDDDEFEWLWAKKVCVLCRGGLVDSQCEIV